MNPLPPSPPSKQLLNIGELAEALRLPYGWLRDEADAGRIPHFRAGKKYRFNLKAVERALLSRASRIPPRADKGVSQ